MIGYIYKIKCRTSNEFYIGSTFNINDRIFHHKKINYNTYSSKKIIERNNYDFIILDTRNFPNNISIKLLENLYILIGWKTKRCINKNLSIRTKSYQIYYDLNYSKNYRLNNSEKVKKYDKLYKEKNKKKIKQYQKKYRDKNNRKVCCIKCKKELLFNNLKRHNNNYH